MGNRPLTTRQDVSRARLTEALVRLERLRIRIVAAKMPTHSVELLDQATFLLRAERDGELERA